ncbi:metallophosphatase [Spongiivirga sp. MCCC 1A20706]|uniref:bifunctional metallophosphatase/5'-nucleotidase n=1 Tax=Spongiivirga sp. MCCC 1A20706 TaxID=3160963 RepID=UPI003977CE5A
MKRRQFIANTAGGAAYLAVGSGLLQSCNLASKKHITILHTNDTHSHIDAIEASHPRHANAGGVARRAQLVEKIRQENVNTLLLDAGDIFQGTAYFNFYGGELEFKLMSHLKYDAATLGNHDFDNGIDGLYAQLPHAKFDFLIANYDFTNTVMNSHTKPYKVYIKDGIRIGIFGLGIELNGLVTQKMYKETKFLDPIEVATDMSRILKEEEHCDLIICLSHLGYEYRNNPNMPSDLTVAAATKNIDLIIGGHTHTFLEKPTIVDNLEGKKVLVNQVGCWGINLGRVDFYFDSHKNSSAEGTSIIV